MSYLWGGRRASGGAGAELRTLRHRPLGAKALIRPEFAEISLAKALEEYFLAISEEEHTRTGIHVSDLVGGNGWKCLLYLYLASQDHSRAPSFVQKMLTKDLKLGEAFHVVVERAAERALVDWAFARGGKLSIDSVRIEDERVDDLGVRYTPDIIVEASLPDGDTVRIVVDVKTVSEAKFASGMRGKSGYTMDAVYRRQLSYYINAEDADFGIFLVVKRDKPFTMHEVMQLPSPATAQTARMKVKDVLDYAVRGELPPANLGKHCNSCGFRRPCAAARGVELPEGEPYIRGYEEDD